MGGCVCIICKYDAILYKGLQHVDSDNEGSRTIPLGIPRVCCQERCLLRYRGWGIDIRAEWATCMQMSVSTGNSQSEAIKQACLVCLRISRETSAGGAEWVTEEMRRNEGRQYGAAQSPALCRILQTVLSTWAFPPNETVITLWSWK